MKLCEKCQEHPTRSQHHLCRLCIHCADPNHVACNRRRRARTAQRQRQGPPVDFHVRPYCRESHLDQAHAPVTVPLPLLAIRGEEMTRSEVAAVLGMTDWGVALLEKRALQRFRDTWVRMFG